MTITIGPYTVLSSGIVIGVLHESVSFQIEDLHFVFAFSNNSEKPEQKLDFIEAADKKGYTLSFVNFNNSLGAGNAAPIHVANMSGKSLHLNYRIYALNGDAAAKTIHYTWLLKPIETTV